MVVQVLFSRFLFSGFVTYCAQYPCVVTIDEIVVQLSFQKMALASNNPRSLIYH